MNVAGEQIREIPIRALLILKTLSEIIHLINSGSVGLGALSCLQALT